MLSVAEKRRTTTPEFEPSASTYVGAAANDATYPGLRRTSLELAEGLILYEEFHPYGNTSYRAANSAIEVRRRSGPGLVEATVQRGNPTPPRSYSSPRMPRIVLVALVLAVGCRNLSTEAPLPGQASKQRGEEARDQADPCAHARAPAPPSTTTARSARDIASAQAAELEAMHREREAAEQDYLIALEAWSNTRASGGDAGPRPRREEFVAAYQKRLHAQIHRRMHAGVKLSAAHGRYGCIEALLEQGRRDAAMRAVDAWTTEEPLHGSAMIAGARVEAALGNRSAAAGWLRATADRLDVSDPLHATGALFFAPEDYGPSMEALLRAQEEYATERPHVLRGIVALARGNEEAAIHSFEAAIAANLKYRHETGETEARVPPQYLGLLAMAVDPASDHGAELATRYGVAHLPSVQRAVVAAVSHLDPRRFRLRIETETHRAVFENVDDEGNEHGYCEGMVVHAWEATDDADERVLLHARDVSIHDPLAAALYIMRRDGQRVRILYRAALFTRSGSSLRVWVGNV